MTPRRHDIKVQRKKVTVKKRPCKTCPDKKISLSGDRTVSIEMPVDETLSQQEGGRLWKHALYGTQTCILLLEGYAQQKLPGDPSEAIADLRDKLSALLEQLGQK